MPNSTERIVDIKKRDYIKKVFGDNENPLLIKLINQNGKTLSKESVRPAGRDIKQKAKEISQKLANSLAYLNQRNDNMIVQEEEEVMEFKSPIREIKEMKRLKAEMGVTKLNNIFRIQLLQRLNELKNSLQHYNLKEVGLNCKLSPREKSDVLIEDRGVKQESPSINSKEGDEPSKLIDNSIDNKNDEHIEFTKKCLISRLKRKLKQSKEWAFLKWRRISYNMASQKKRGVKLLTIVITRKRKEIIDDVFHIIALNCAKKRNLPIITERFIRKISKVLNHKERMKKKFDIWRDSRGYKLVSMIKDVANLIKEDD